jgi:hypothetical protein
MDIRDELDHIGRVVLLLLVMLTTPLWFFPWLINKYLISRS